MTPPPPSSPSATRPAPIKVLACHAYYQQRGGEDQSFDGEVELLESRGHEVIRFTRHNDELREVSKLGAAKRTLWNGQIHRELRDVLKRERPDVMHCTNFFPLLSPAVCHAAKREGIPMVQSLRNYRLLCLNGLFLRDGRVCEDCLGKAVPLPGIRHACYRDSRVASAGVAAMLMLHRVRRTWSRAVDLFITPSAFARDKLVEGGFPADKIAVKPNFVDPDPGKGSGDGGYALFVGRLSTEKGVETLLGGWRALEDDTRLHIVGDGPMAPQVEEAARNDKRITWHGRRSQEEVHQIMGAASCLVMPSVCYETFGRTIVEAFAAGTPVVTSRLGAMTELVIDGENGLHFNPGDSPDLAAKVTQLRSDPATLSGMRTAARTLYEQRFTAAANYQQLLAHYDRVLPPRTSP